MGIVIVNADGIPIRSTLENSLTVQYAALITQLAAKAKSCVRDLDPQVRLIRGFSPICQLMLTLGQFSCCRMTSPFCGFDLRSMRLWLPQIKIISLL